MKSVNTKTLFFYLLILIALVKSQTLLESLNYLIDKNSFLKNIDTTNTLYLNNNNYQNTESHLLSIIENDELNNNINNNLLFLEETKEEQLTSSDNGHIFDNNYNKKTSNSVNSTCSNRKKDGNIIDFYYFLPSLRGILYSDYDSVNFEGCFHETILKLNLKGNQAVINISASKKKNFFCSEYLLISTSRIYKSKVMFRSGIHSVVLKNLTDDDLNEIRVSGIRILGFCDNIFKELSSLFKTASLFLGGFTPKHAHIPKRMQKINIDFIKRYVNLDIQERSDNFSKNILNIDKNLIKTGDFFAVTRLDGLDQLIMMGTGSSLGHTTVAVWIDDELYIVESQDGWYWSKHGIQRNKYDDWMKNALNADFNVYWIPLKEEIRKNFDEDKAKEFFLSKEGLNYGYHNFLFPWLDGNNNLPKFIDYKIIMPLFSIFEKLAPTVFNKIIGEALNIRIKKLDYESNSNLQGLKELKTKNLDTSNLLNLNQIVSAAAKHNMTFEDLVAIPEEYGWKYSDGENFVCSCFVTAFLKAGGAFGDLEILPQEFGPKDLYQTNLWNNNSDSRPEVCKTADPNFPFCQIMGKWRIEFKGVNSINPYSHMNEKCDSVGPEFVRNDGC